MGRPEQAPVDECEPLPPAAAVAAMGGLGTAALASVAIVAVGAVGLWFARQVNPPGDPGMTLNVMVDTG